MDVSPSLVQTIEAVAARAWPALEVTDLDGWWLRASQGVTRRGNSVWPNALRGELHGSALDGAIDMAEHFYRARALPPRFQMCPAARPSALDPHLAGRGYRAVAQTAVQTAPVADVLARLAGAPPHAVSVEPIMDEPWLAVYHIVEEAPAAQIAVRRAIMEQIPAPVAYVCVAVAGEVVACGSAVVERPWVGLFNVGTRPEFRRQGAAQAGMRALLAWAARQGAEQCYLQVMVSNAPALALYAQLGFVPCYTYHYRELAGTQAPTVPEA
jgi:GNAT superfamily N-acetyltransferase